MATNSSSSFHSLDEAYCHTCVMLSKMSWEHLRQSSTIRGSGKNNNYGNAPFKLTNSYNEVVEWNKNFNFSFNHAMIEPESFTMIMFSCQPPSHVQDKWDKWDTVIWPHMLATAAKGWNVLYSEWPEISKQYIITYCFKQFSTTPRISLVLDFAFQLISKSVRTAKLKSLYSHTYRTVL